MCTNLTIHCADQTLLAATLYAAKHAPAGGVLIGPATGVKRQFYHHFARYLSSQGFTVLTYDNRGIGDSLHGSVSDCMADLVQWGSLDMPAALSALRQHVADAPLYLLGHSAGGQLAGLMPNVQQFNAIFNFGSSSGQLDNMAMPYRLKAHFFMNLFIPLSNLLVGHTHAQWLNMGEPLPKRVASQWRRWCNGQGYAVTGFGKEIAQHWYEDVRAPIHWVLASDDDIANYTNVHNMASVFRHADNSFEVLHPEANNLREIGHMKFFSRRCSALWPMVSEFFRRHASVSRESLTQHRL
ncbi:alpha/beta fold hydrolase [Alteromonas aestuariivivens]|uniref:Alpha/beta fold hydrolase n=1 Tax=Alteromonas aestuariivivens TaxID=1938339 RepID=A0A3D8M9H4_9ALTE|nr:alpha/beta fold hydrolase [Alteromonas aestuariivivens]RDV26693.1 alpha/beta fold hydrolase [Alteromonas aestuariivivens]